MGRKKIEIDLVEVEKLAAIGLNEQQVADSLGISVPTLERRKKESEDFVSALKRGKAKGIAQVANNLFQQSKSGNVSAGIFYMKNRAGWKDKTETEHNGNVSITATPLDENI
jgi:hypothetical protein